MASDLNLTELERLAAEATPGEWTANTRTDCSCARPQSTIVCGSRDLFHANFHYHDNGGNDARLIAAMRNSLPELIRIARAVQRWGESRAVGSLAGYMELNEIANSLAGKEG